MENKIRKIIREQIKKLKEGNNSIRIFGSKDMKDYIVDVSINDILKRGKDVLVKRPHSEDNYLINRVELKDGTKGWVFSQNQKLGEGMSPEEFAAAKEADRLSKHPERDKILKIQKMMDKERKMTDYEKRRKKEDDYYQDPEDFKEIATELGYLDEEYSQIIDNREAHTHPDFQTLINQLKEIGLKTFDETSPFGSLSSFGKGKGYYVTLDRNAEENQTGLNILKNGVWSENANSVLELAFKGMEQKTKEFNFIFDGLSDEEVDPGERIYPPEITFFIEPKELNEIK